MSDAKARDAKARDAKARAAFGARLRHAREQAGVTQQQLATLLGVSDGAVNHWEAGRWQPQAIHLPRIAQRLGTTVDWLFGTPEGELFEARAYYSRKRGHVQRVRPHETQALVHGPALAPYLTPDDLVQLAHGKLELAAVARHWPSGLADPEALFVMDMPDSALEPAGIPRGSRLTLDTRRSPEPGEVIAVVLRASDEILVRRYRAVEGKAGPPFILRADTDDHGERAVSAKDQPAILGVLVAALSFRSR